MLKIQTETAEQMRERISTQIRADFKREINNNWIFQGNKHVRNNNFFSWFLTQFLHF